MRLLWTKSNNTIDMVIRLMTGDDCQHFVIVFDSPGGGIVFQFNLLGGGVSFLSTFLKNHTIVHEKIVTLTTEQEDALWDAWVDRFDGKGYNILGALYAGLMRLRLRVLKIPSPSVNAWSQPGTQFCDEAYQLLSGLPGLPLISQTQNGMDTPHDVWEILKEPILSDRGMK
jgi:hypothetical protein